jgi:hypothetical protein
MSYYMRYIVNDEKEISILDIEQGLKGIHSQYAIVDGDLKYGNDLYGQIEINRPGDESFEEEIEEFKSELEETRGKGKKKVEAVLTSAKTIVAVQVLWQGRKTEETLQKIYPLWYWLFANRQGLLYADGEGYYEFTKLILRVE